MNRFALSLLEVITDIKNYIAGENYYKLVEKQSLNNFNKKDQDIEIDKNSKDFKLKNLNSKIAQCNKCRLFIEKITNVFEDGNYNADIMIIGDFPDNIDETFGKPFKGKIGELLDKMLNAIKLDRKDVYLCNILKCNPGIEKLPVENEINQCIEYIYDQINIVSPKIILLFGVLTSQYLLKLAENFEEIRKKNYNKELPYIISDDQKINAISTYHPRQLLKDQSLKSESWNDMKLFAKICSEIGIRKNPN